MDTETSKVMFALLRSAVCGDPLTDGEKALFHADMLPRIVRTAQRHDVAHLLALGLKRNRLPDESGGQLDAELFRAVYRHEQMNYELTRLCGEFEKAEIPFIPLKGSVLCRYYPEPWMRTSCDIDILVHGEDLERAVSALEEHLAYRREGKSPHDVSMFTRDGRHTELHYSLAEAGGPAAKVLGEVWRTAVRREGRAYCFDMPDEMFYFYHIAHMAKHFENGGCGIRPFLDVWVLNHRVPFDREKRGRLLADGGLSAFAEQAGLLSEIWFGEARHTELTRKMQTYILRGGLYGADENRIAVQQQKRGGKIGYALSKIFIPYDTIRFHYPILERHRWLTPAMEVRRWGKLIFCGHLRRTARELRYSGSISKDMAESTRAFLEELGL